MEAIIEAERAQLLSQWKSAFKENPDWFSPTLSQISAILRLRTAGPQEQKKIGDYLRKFHDRLGYMAKGTVQAGGVCAGAIFRTTKFMQTSERSAARVNRSIHIEHTTPIWLLREEIVRQELSSPERLLVWLMKHSVTTAIHIQEEKLIERSKRYRSDALNPSSAEFQRPFLRYKGLFDGGSAVWNVLDGTIVDPDTFTFKQHFEIVARLLDLTCAGEMAKRLRQTEVDVQ